jgi:hypothetical protein
MKAAMIADMSETWENAGLNRACSSNGYCVRILGLTGFEYEEGDLTLHPQSESLWGSAGFGLSARSIEGTPARRAEVVKRIRAGLEFLGWKLQVDDDV